MANSTTSIIAISLIIATLVFGTKLLLQRRQALFPLVGQSNAGFLSLPQLTWLRQGPRIIHEAYDQNRDRIVQLPTTDRKSVLLPIRYLDEISNLPHSVASNSRATSDFFVGQWTTLDYEIFAPAVLEAIRTQYISKLSQQVAPAAAEAAYAFNKHLSAYCEWTPIAVQPKVQCIVAQIVARAIGGPEVCRNAEWTESVISYAQNVFFAATYLKAVPWIFRPLVAAFTPNLYRIYLCRRRILKIISPLIKQRLDWRQNQPEFWAARLKSSDMCTLDWLVETSKPHEATPEMIAHRLTGVSFGATHTTSNQITNSLFDLAANFERWAPPLREEIEGVLGSRSSDITNADISKMWKLDSFMKEAQRFHPPSLLSVNRTVQKSFKLSTGEHIPKDTHICFAGVPISMDDNYFPDAKSFDGFRFERLRRDSDTRHSGLQFTSSYPGTLHFGHGRHICPGRFMGALIGKLLIIEVLLRYDLKLKDGESRPENLTFMDMDMPDPTSAILFRDRQ